MLQWIQGISLRDHIRNEETRKGATFQPIITHLMQKHLHWYGHVRCRGQACNKSHARDVGRCPKKAKTKIHGYHQKIYQIIKKNWLTDINIFQSLKNDSFQGAPLVWKGIQSRYGEYLIKPILLISQVVSGSRTSRWLLLILTRRRS